MVPAISRQGEDLIRQVTDYTASLTDDGMTPTDALVKAARELQLPAGHLPLAARAYNVAASEAHRKSASDLETKVGDFPIVDPEAAREALYPTEVLSPAAKVAKTIVSPHYSRAPRGPADAQKRAELLAPLLTEKKAKARTEPADATTSWNKVEAVRGQAKRADLVSRQAFEKVVTILGQVREQMSKVASDSLEAVTEYAVHCYGDTGKTAMKMVGHGFTPARTKKAHIMEEAGSKVRGLIDQLVEQSQKYADLREASAVQLAKAAKATEQFWESSQASRPVDALGLPIPEGPPLNPTKRASVFPMMAGAMGTTLARDLSSKLPTAAPTAKLEDRMYQKLTDPSHEQEIRNAQSTAMLSDFMANDPVISGYDPDEVVQRYNGVAQLMPHGVTRGELMRATLRKALASGGNLDPFDVSEMIKMDLALKGVDSRPQPQSQGMSGGPPAV